jgi:RNA polymerase sigma-54 factor
MEQRLVQSPQMIQAMQILQLSSLDLAERIEQELTENPFLEEQEPETDDGADAPRSEPETHDPEERGVESMLDELERYDRDFGDGTRTRIGSSEDGDKKLEAMQNTAASYHSQGDALLEQLALSDMDEREHEVAEYLIYSLDHRGYLPEPLEEVASDCPIPDVTVEELEITLERLRDATHPALGAPDLRSCLLLQLDAHGIEGDLVRKLVANHLEDITMNRLPRIARETEHSIEEIKSAIETIRGLDPVPGREYGDPGAAVIHPDVIVEDVEGTYEVRLARQRLPDLTINPSYKRLLQEATDGDGVQEWVKKRLEAARWFIDAVYQRQSTLLRIANSIFGRQQGFLDHGVKALVPLRMQEVADEAGVHISTVSRAVAGKYAQTPRGIHALKYFFTGGTAKASGEMTSQRSIKLRIQEMIAQEDGQSPLSDDEVAKRLESQDGVKIARRTVTKYRKALAIPSSSQRKTF